MDNIPIKCASRDFTKDPFYLVQKNGSEQRFVASFGNKEKIKLFLLEFIKNENELQVKIRDLDNADSPVDHDGRVTKQKLTEALNRFEEVIFHDGYHDLMIRLPGSGDYLAFDEHGLIFIYSQGNYPDILKKFGLTYKGDEKLIYQFNHWHYRPAKAEEELASLIKELDLQNCA
jgi:hypothetical protein